MKEIVVYSTSMCPKCKELKKVLDAKNVDYKVESNVDKIMKKAKDLNTSELPILSISSDEMGSYGKVDYFSGSEAVNKGKEM